MAATLLAWGVAQLAGVDLGVAQPGQGEVPIGAVNVASSVVIFGGAGWPRARSSTASPSAARS